MKMVGGRYMVYETFSGRQIRQRTNVSRPFSFTKVSTILLRMSSYNSSLQKLDFGGILK